MLTFCFTGDMKCGFLCESSLSYEMHAKLDFGIHIHVFSHCKTCVICMPLGESGLSTEHTVHSFC